MDSKQTKIVLGLLAFVVVAWIFSPLFCSFREQGLPVSRTPLSFDEAGSYRLMQGFVTQYPARVLGSMESRQSTGYIREHLESLGYSISYSHFDARIAGRKQVGRNVLAYKQGKAPEMIALVAHLDTARTTVQGAMDNGSGVGVLLELARIFAAGPTQRSLLVIFSDGEEWGMLGARDLAGSYPERSRLAAVLCLDHVGIGDLEALRLEETGQLKGFTPPWLRHLARQAAESQGLRVIGPSGFSEYLERAFLISWADQGPFLSAGVPAINLGSESKEATREREIYHSAGDTIEKLKPASIGAYGRAAERIARTLDEMPSIPAESSEPFRVWDALFLRPHAIAALQVMLFLPTALVFVAHVKNHRHRLRPILVGREILAFAGTVLPFGAIYFSIALFRALRLIPLYTLYPAAIKDPVLENLPWRVLSGIAATALFVAAACYILAKFAFADLPRPSFYVSKIVLLALLVTGVGLSLCYNPYWASLFFVFPAWIWALAGPRSPGRGMNRILIVAAAIPYFGLAWVCASRLQLGWALVWYQVLALSTGLFTKAAYFLATGIIAIGIRFLAIQSHEDLS